MLHQRSSGSPIEGMAILSGGFRPFFFFGSLYAALSMLVWIPFYFAEVEIPIAVSVIDWHYHEILFGIMPAIIAGFLLAAIPNWTGRLPVKGKALAVLFAIWVLGRIAFNTSAYFGLGATSVIDCAFLVLLCATAAREIIAGKNWKNLRVLLIVGALALGNIAFYVEAISFDETLVSRNVGIAAIAMLVMIIGGRIIPSFTRNWLARQEPGRLPIPFNQIDKIILAITLAALVMWITQPEHLATGVLMIVSACFHIFRLSRWAGDRTVGSYILLILHLAYIFLPVGFILIGIHILSPITISEAAGIHAIGTGGFGTMVLGVMVRATRGHTGHELKTDLGAAVAFTAILVSATLRVLVALNAFGEFETLFLRLSQLGWCLAFLSFAAFYAPKLWLPRKS